MLEDRKVPFVLNCPLCGQDIHIENYFDNVSCPDKECPANVSGSFEIIRDFEGVLYLVETFCT
ncbi:MAG: hypothetical protein ACTSW7_01535 [Candidatus Thorarchaeota archaeon]